MERIRLSTIIRASLFAAVALGLTGCDRPTTTTSQPSSQPTSAAPVNPNPRPTPSSRATSQPTTNASRLTDGWNLLLISIDTLRADHLGCYGNQRVRTPNIDRLAGEGVRFMNATTVAPITLPAHSSLMTGVEPYIHGARDNGIYTLSDENVTLAEVLSGAGYRTSAHVGADVIRAESGLAQGFASYTDPRSSRRAGDAPPERPAEAVVGDAMRWLNEHAKERFFLFVHLFDPHRPYLAPQRFTDVYPTEPYLAEISYADEQVGVLLAGLERLGVNEKTLVVLTADHGEGLTQHEELTHAFLLYDSTLSIPLIFRAPGALKLGRVVDDQVSIVDCMPTILSCLGIGGPPMQGRDLSPLLSDSGTLPPHGAYSESLSGYFNFQFSPLRSWRENGWKYIHAPQPELYDLRNDPGETHNVAVEQPERVRQMAGELRKRVESAVTRRVHPSLKSIDSDDMRSLQALGYVNSGSTPEDFDELALLNPSGENPATQMRLVRVIGEVPAMMYFKQNAQAEKLLRSVLEDPTLPGGGAAVVHASLANSLAAQAKFAEALPHFEEALKLNPRDNMTRMQYGLALMEIGRNDDAATTLHAATSGGTGAVEAHELLSYILCRRNDFAGAAKEFEEAVKGNPTRLGPLRRLAGPLQLAPDWFDAAGNLTAPDEYRMTVALAAAAAERGFPDVAAAQYARAAKLRASAPLPHVGLARVLDTGGHLPEALKALGNALQLAPNNAVIRARLGAALTSARKYDEAAKELETALKTQPDCMEAALALAWLRATCPDAKLRDGARAVQLADTVLRSVSDAPDPRTLDVLAAAQAETGAFEDAARTAADAIQRAKAAGERALQREIRARRDRYLVNEPYRLPAAE